MKKLVLAMLVILAFATSSFAGVSFLTAPSVGEGNWAVLGLYATNHQGDIGNAGDPQYLDSNSLGVRGEYGVMKDLDLLVSYSFDTLVNVKELDAKQTSGNTVGLGAKYSLGKVMGVESAVAFGYESSDLGLKADAGGSTAMSATAISIGYVVSSQMDNLMPYGAIAYKMLSQNPGKVYTGTTVDSMSGTGLAINLGCMIGIAANQAVAIEYNTENQAWGELTKSGTKLNDPSSVNVSGISLGYVYMF